MSLIAHSLDTLVRPALLARAARCGQPFYRRERDLPRLLELTAPPSPERAVFALREMEAELDEMRRSRTGTYDMALHVALLIALVAEARLADSDEGVGL